MSISSRISSMEEHVTNAYDGLQGLGADLTGIDKNIDNIAMVLDDIYDSMPQVSGEGTSLTLDDTRVGKIKSTLKGNTSQTTYSGKNLLHQDQYLTTRTTNGITYTNNGDGTFNVTGTATANTNIQILAGASQIGLESGKTYYFYSSKPYNGTDFNMSIPFAQDGAQKYLTANNTIATSGTLTNIKLSFYVGSGVTVNAQNVKLMLVEGSTPGDYEPFVGGTTSPNPSYPQPVNVVSGDNEVEIVGKNLLKYPYLNTTSTVSGVTFTDNGDGSITIDGTSTSSTYSLWFLYENAWNYNSLSFELAPGTYTFKGLGASRVRMAINFYTSDNANQYFEVFNQDVTKTITEKVRVNARLIVNGGATVDNVTVYPQIEIGSTSSSFEPYNGDEYPINLPVVNLFDESSAILNVGISTNNGGTYPDTNLFITDYIPIDINTKYTVNSASSTGNRVFGAFYDSNKSFLGAVATNVGERTFTVTNANAKYVRITGQKVNIDTYQLEKGSKANSYTPYGTTPIELCKIGNYQDYFYKDSGKWYLHKEVGKVVLNGSESGWHTSSLSVEGYKSYYVDSSVRINQDALGSKCNYFEYKTYNEWQNLLKATFIENTYQAIGIRVIETLAPTLEDFKTWLSTHNTIAYFALATPTTIEVEYQPLIDQLNLLEKAQSKENQTNISQVNNDLPFIISASALKEWQESTSLNSTLSMVNPLSLGNTLNAQENNTQPIEVDNIEPLEEV